MVIIYINCFSNRQIMVNIIYNIILYILYIIYYIYYIITIVTRNIKAELFSNTFNHSLVMMKIVYYCEHKRYIKCGKKFQKGFYTRKL